MVKARQADPRSNPTQQAELVRALDGTLPAGNPPSMIDPTHAVRTSPATLDDDAVRNRAYEIWQRAGSPDGSHEEHWAQARSELKAEAATAGSSEQTPQTPTSAEEVR